MTGIDCEVGSTTTLDNTIIALNTYQGYDTLAAGYSDIAGGPVSQTSANNLIGIGGSGGLTNGSDGNLVGVANPGLAAGLANIGGPTQTIALLPGSPAIDAGSTRLASMYVFPGHQPRRNGLPRIVNGTVDIGAFESPVFGNPTVYTVTDISVQLPDDTGDLLYAINQANNNTNPAGSEIEFDPTVFGSPQTITLASTLVLSETAGPEVIDGPGASLVTVSGNNAVEVFSVGERRDGHPRRPHHLGRLDATATVAAASTTTGHADGHQLHHRQQLGRLQTAAASTTTAR